MSRKAARDLAFKLIYQLEMHREDIDEQIAIFYRENSVDDKDKEYINEVVRGVLHEKDALDGFVQKYSRGWKLSRISKVDLAILRLALYEMTRMKEIPQSVSINEAVELAKKYSGSEAGAYINGVLGRILREELEQESKL